MLLHKLVRVRRLFCASFRCVITHEITHEPPFVWVTFFVVSWRFAPSILLNICRTVCVLVCILHVRELRRTKWFGKVGGGETIVLRTRVLVIQVKVNTTSGLAGEKM